jgi:hypothetical protein
LVWDNSAEPVKPREQRTKKELVRGKIVERAVKEVKNGMYINLGVGMPNLVPAYLPPGVTATLHSENGVLGVGRYPRKGEEDADLMNAGKVFLFLLFKRNLSLSMKVPHFSPAQSLLVSSEEVI